MYLIFFNQDLLVFFFMVSIPYISSKLPTNYSQPYIGEPLTVLEGTPLNRFSDFSPKPLWLGGSRYEVRTCEVGTQWRIGDSVIKGSEEALNIDLKENPNKVRVSNYYDIWSFDIDINSNNIITKIKMHPTQKERTYCLKGELIKDYRFETFKTKNPIKIN